MHVELSEYSFEIINIFFFDPSKPQISLCLAFFFLSNFFGFDFFLKFMKNALIFVFDILYTLLSRSDNITI